MSLDEIGLRHGTDKASSWHDYLRMYETIVPAGIPIKLLEIGWDKGASMRMWRDYLHPESIVVGVDIEQAPEPINRVHFRNVDATTSAIADVACEFGPFDVIVDDGSHMSPDVISTFWLLWPYVAPGGLFIIEDIHVAYHPDYQGWDPTDPGDGPTHGRTSMQFLKLLADDLHHGHCGAGPAARFGPPDVASLFLQPGVAVLRKASA
jgi:cephalosporin hydroxylase